jgi:hypothetical protein
LYDEIKGIMSKLIIIMSELQIKVIATTLGKMVKSVVLEGRVPILIGTVPSVQVFNGLAQTFNVINSSPMEQRTGFVNSSEVGSESQDGPDESSTPGDAFTNLCGSVSTGRTSSFEQRKKVYDA